MESTFDPPYMLRQGGRFDEVIGIVCKYGEEQFEQEFVAYW